MGTVLLALPFLSLGAILGWQYRGGTFWRRAAGLSTAVWIATWAFFSWQYTGIVRMLNICDDPTSAIYAGRGTAACIEAGGD